MREFSDQEIAELLVVRGGSAQAQAAAKAVVVAAIQENLKLGRIAQRAQKSSWNRNHSILRSPISGDWQTSMKPGLD